MSAYVAMKGMTEREIARFAASKAVIAACGIFAVYISVTDVGPPKGLMARPTAQGEA